MRRIIALLITALLVFSMISVLAQDADSAPVTLMGFEPSDNYRSWPDNLFFQRIQEKTGVSFTYIQYGTVEEYKAALNALSDGKDNVPQVLFKAGLDVLTAKKLYDEGVLVDLAPYLKDYAPNLSRLLDSDPSLRQAITLEGGVIPALPYILSSLPQNILWINSTWLDELKLSPPATLDELEAVLTAFSIGDPNRNGQKDEIPLSFLGAYDLKYLAHAWGLAANDFNVYMDEGKAVFMPEKEAFEQFLTKMAAWYEAGLLDKSGFTTIDTLRRVTDAKSTNRYGAFFAPLPTGLVPLEWVSQYKALLPLSHEGETTYRAVAGRVNFGTFALTSACRDIPRMLSWVDYLYTEEGAKLAGIGLENEDYIFDGDGSWRLIRENPDTTYLSRVVIATDQSAPGVSAEDFQKLYTDKTVRDLTEQTALVAAQSVLPFPEIPLTEEEVREIAPLQNKLGRYVDESIARFVIGEWPADEAHFETFRSELKTLGVDAFLAVWQAIYDKGMK